MVFLPSGKCLHTATWMLMKLKEKTWWELYKNSICYLEQILEGTAGEVTFSNRLLHMNVLVLVNQQVYQHCVGTGCSLENLPKVMDDKELHALSPTWPFLEFLSEHHNDQIITDIYPEPVDNSTSISRVINPKSCTKSILYTLVHRICTIGFNKNLWQA